jgi:4-amino-4-deoxy-L-arabinose transferase-like glycosyltransferase
VSEPRATGLGRSGFAVLGLILLVGTALRFYGLRMGLPHLLARPDEYTIVDRIRPLFAGHLDPQYYIYPSLYLYLVAGWIEAGLKALSFSIRHFGWPAGIEPGTYLTTYWTRPDVLILIGRVGHALLGTATIALVAAVALAMSGREAALAAAAIVATNVLHVRDSHALKADVVLATACLIACAAFARFGRAPTRQSALLAGAAFGAALGIKQTAVLLAVPLGVAALMAAPGGLASRFRQAFASLVLAGCVALVVFAATSPFMVLNLFGHDMQLIWYGLTDPARVQLFTAFAEPPPPLASRYLYHLERSLLGGCGLAFTVLAAAALVRAALRRDVTRVVLASFIVTWAAVICASSQRYSRYLTPIVLPLAILIGDLLAATLSSATLGIPSRRRGAVLALAMVLIVAEPLVASLALDRLSARKDTRVAAQEWLAAHARPGDVVLGVGTRMWGFGTPQMPPGVRLVMAPEGPLTPESLHGSNARFVVTHFHPRLPFSAAGPGTLDLVSGELVPLADFDPFVPGTDPGLYEPQDALYMPLRGTRGVKQPGPLIRIYGTDRAHATDRAQ